MSILILTYANPEVPKVDKDVLSEVLNYISGKAADECRLVGDYYETRLWPGRWMCFRDKAGTLHLIAKATGGKSLLSELQRYHGIACHVGKVPT